MVNVNIACARCVIYMLKLLKICLVEQTRHFGSQHIFDIIFDFGLLLVSA